MSEAEVKAAVLRVAYRMGWIVYHQPMIKTLRPAKRSTSGYPDLTLARDGEVLWIECKTEAGKLSSDQLLWQQALPAYHVIRPSDLDFAVERLLS